ncbi:hypothetical protein HQ576_11710 [bacterium]|nr:hypothetical protein [bacterium]
MNRRSVFGAVALLAACGLVHGGQVDLEAGFVSPPAACRATMGWFHAPQFQAALSNCPAEVKPAFDRALADAGLSTTPEEIKRMATWQALSDVALLAPPGLPVRPPSQPYDALAKPLDDFVARLIFMGRNTQPEGGLFTQAKPAHGITIYPPAPALTLARRKAGDADVYLAVSQQKIDTVCTVTIPRLATPEFWSPEDGSIADAPAFFIQDKSTAVNLRLGPYEALFIVLRKPPTKQHVTFAPTLQITRVAADGSSVSGLARLNGRCSVMFASGKMHTAVVEGLPPALPVSEGWTMKTRSPAKRLGVGITQLRWRVVEGTEADAARWAAPDFDDAAWETATVGGPKPVAVGGSPWQANWLRMQGHKQQRFYRRTVELPEKPDLATVTVTADNGYELFVNGQRMGSNDDWKDAETYDVLKALRQGRNVLAVCLSNDGPFGGLLLESRIRLASGRLVRVVTDASWKVAATAPKGWEQPDFDDAKWAAPKDIVGKPPVAPWGEIPGLPEDPTASQLTWYRFTLPAGARSVSIPAGLKQPKLWVNGKSQPIRDGKADLSAAVQAKPVVAALCAVGPGIIDKPIYCECAAGAVGVGNWLLVGYPTYAGLADYTADVAIPAAYRKERLVLDLGDVGCAARASVNGKDLGTRLWRPYTFDISDVAREGKNTIQITVANAAANARATDLAGERLAAGLIGPVVIRPLRPLTIKAQ